MSMFEMAWQTLVLTLICYASIYTSEMVGVPFYIFIPIFIAIVVVGISSFKRWIGNDKLSGTPDQK